MEQILAGQAYPALPIHEQTLSVSCMTIRTMRWWEGFGSGSVRAALQEKLSSNGRLWMAFTRKGSDLWSLSGRSNTRPELR